MVRPQAERDALFSRLLKECLNWVAAQDLGVDESEDLVDDALGLRWRCRGTHEFVARYFAHPRLARVCLLAAALDVSECGEPAPADPLRLLFAEFEAAAPLDLQRACSTLDVSAVLSRLGRRDHRRFMLAVRPCLARAAEVIADQVALDTREGMRQLDFALSFMLRHRHDAIAHRLLAQLEAREDLAAARTESARILSWSIAFARCRTAGRALDREEFQRQLARAIEQLSPAFSPVQRWRLGRMRLRDLEPYVRTDARALGLAELWSEYAALMPGYSPSSIWIDWRPLHRRRRRRRKNVDSSASDTSSPP